MTVIYIGGGATKHRRRSITIRPTEARVPAALAAGTLLDGRYAVGRVLGSGGFGITYLAYDRTLERTVAVKEYFPAGLAARACDGVTTEVLSMLLREDFECGMRRFLAEADLLAGFVGCGGIASVYGSFSENGTAYSVMEYVNGETLADYVAKRGPLCPSEAVYIMKRAAEALRAVHSENILHRDISPENIMLCRRGGVKLIDFGTARQLSPAGQKSMTVIVKPSYTPLEQYSRRGNQDGRTDIYSLGTSMYYALTLTEPDDSMMRADDDRDFARGLRQIPRELSDVIAKASALRMEDRYADAGELIGALERCGISEKCFAKAARGVFDRRAAVTAGLCAAAVIASALGMWVFDRSAAVDTPGIVGADYTEAAETASAGGSDDAPAEAGFVKIGGRAYPADSEVLDLSGLGLSDSDIIGLRYMSELKNLKLENNLLTDISVLKGLTQLECVNFNNNSVDSIDFAAGMHRLSEISGSGNLITDISPLKGKTELRSVFFIDNPITDITPLSGCDKMQSIGFGGTRLESIEPLSRMKELEMICLSDCGLTDISALSGCGAARFVYLGENMISDISPLYGLAPDVLYLNNNILGGMRESFAGLTVNETLAVYGNGFSEDDEEYIAGVVNGDFAITDI